MLKDITHLDLLRHGELATPGLFCAKTNEELSDKGLQNLTDVTKDKHWDVIITSPSQRCISFAKVLSKQKNIQLIVDDRFQEMDFGTWMGRASDDLWKEEPEKLSQLWTSPESFCAPEGETMQAFQTRVEDGLKKQLIEYENKSILLVTHAGVIRSILSVALEISPISTMKFNIAYAHISRLHYYPDGLFSLQSLGEGKGLC